MTYVGALAKYAYLLTKNPHILALLNEIIQLDKMPRDYTDTPKFPPTLIKAYEHALLETRHPDELAIVHTLRSAQYMLSYDKQKGLAELKKASDLATQGDVLGYVKLYKALDSMFNTDNQQADTAFRQALATIKHPELKIAAHLEHHKLFLRLKSPAAAMNSLANAIYVGEQNEAYQSSEYRGLAYLARARFKLLSTYGIMLRTNTIHDVQKDALEAMKILKAGEAYQLATLTLAIAYFTLRDYKQAYVFVNVLHQSAAQTPITQASAYELEYAIQDVLHPPQDLSRIITAVNYLNHRERHYLEQGDEDLEQQCSELSDFLCSDGPSRLYNVVKNAVSQNTQALLAFTAQASSQVEDRAVHYFLRGLCAQYQFDGYVLRSRCAVVRHQKPKLGESARLYYQRAVQLDENFPLARQMLASFTKRHPEIKPGATSQPLTHALQSNAASAERAPGAHGQPKPKAKL